MSKFSTTAILEPDGKTVTVMGKRFVLESEVDRLQAELNKQVSSHGLYITQTIEPKMEELREENARLRKILKRIQNCDPHPDLSSHKYYDAMRYIRQIINEAQLSAQEANGVDDNGNPIRYSVSSTAQHECNCGGGDAFVPHSENCAARSSRDDALITQNREKKL